MMAAAALGVARGVLTEDDRSALRALITQMGPLPPVGDLSAGQALEAVSRDKKVIAGTLHFVLPTGIGSTTTVRDVAMSELTGAATEIGLEP